MITTEAAGNGIFTESQLVALFKADGRKVSKALFHLDKLLPQLTRDELKQLYDRMTFDELADPNLEPEQRRELLSRMDVCPCCQHWLGHNRPPADDDGGNRRRQTSFDF